MVDTPPPVLKPCHARTVYLITYSKADLTRFPTRASFADIVVKEFNKYGLYNRVEYWSCAKEKHKEEGHHYHLAIKLNGVYRWLAVKENIRSNYNIVLNFLNISTGYYNAYAYTTKKDRKYILSDNHPPEVEAPVTTKAIAARSTLGEINQNPIEPPPCKRPRSLQPSDLFDIVINNNIKDDDGLCAYANRLKKEENNPLLSNYILTRDEKKRDTVIRTAWKLHTSAEVIARKNKTRIEILHEAKTEDCIPTCDGKWLHYAHDTLRKNQIDAGVFSTAVYELLLKGRGKDRNVILVGPSNCAKTFLLKPLKNLYKCFITPTKGTFNWVGAEKSECVFLNDFRWSDRVIPWSDLLNLLEGEPIQVPVPKTHFAENPMWTRDTPIFATSKSKLRKYECGVVDEIETEMMDSRWKYFIFRHRIEKKDAVSMKPCKKCFADLILGSD